MFGFFCKFMYYNFGSRALRSLRVTTKETIQRDLFCTEPPGNYLIFNKVPVSGMRTFVFISPKSS